jgi:hypothetical protein
VKWIASNASVTKMMAGEKLRAFGGAAMEFSIAPLGGACVGYGLNGSLARRDLAIAALCATFAFVLDQQFVATVFAAQFAFALTEAIRRAR